MARADLVLMIWFAINTGILLAPYLAYPWAFGGDARVYAQAAGLWLTGQDPWAPLPGVAVSLVSHPHLLLFYAPFAGLDPTIVGFTWTIGLLVLSALAIRRLGLPLWWLAFPPLADAIRWGSADALLLPLLVIGPRWLAPIAKPYAGLALLADRRWLDAAISILLGIVLLAVLPWRQFVSHLPDIATEIGLNAQDLSAFGEPVAMVLGVIALASLGWRRGLWLATPVLWPSTQLHYAAMTVPALSRSVAFFFAVPIPGAPVVGVVVGAILARWRPGFDPEVVPASAREPQALRTDVELV
jgi:hypothetical protein